MLIHSVYFWLNEEEDIESVLQFEEGLASLFEDPAVESGYYGKPAGTPPRPVIEESYSYGLVLIFADQAAHDRYQVGPIHKRFLAENSVKWARLHVLDIEA
jgi:hypothetical protein